MDLFKSFAENNQFEEKAAYGWDAFQKIVSITESEPGAFFIPFSTNFFTNVTNSTLKTDGSGNTRYDAVNLSWQNAFNEFFMEINLTVPASEPAGAKYSNITFTVISNE